MWTWIAFLVALPLMWKFVYGPITSALEDRDRKVDDAIKAAESARKQAEEQAVKAQDAVRMPEAKAAPACPSWPLLLRLLRTLHPERLQAGSRRPLRCMACLFKTGFLCRRW